MSMVLYGYWRSSAAYRVRIALNLKGLNYQTKHVSLIDGDQRSAEFLEINAQGLVPVLFDGNAHISQSLAILEYLEDMYTEVPLLPADPCNRATVRQIAQLIACDIHPLCNLRVLNYLKETLGADEDAKLQWYRHWVREGLTALEKRVSKTHGKFCVGDMPTFADACLIPQLYNAERFDVPDESWPTLREIARHCNQHPAFADAHPDSNREA